MFGFDEKVELKKTPTQEICDYVKKMIELIDSTANYDKVFYKKLVSLFDNADKIVKNLSYTEQGKINTYWSSLTMLLKQSFPMFYSMGSLMKSSIDMNVPNIRTWCLGILGQIS